MDKLISPFSISFIGVYLVCLCSVLACFGLFWTAFGDDDNDEGDDDGDDDGYDDGDDDDDDDHHHHHHLFGFIFVPLFA